MPPAREELSPRPDPGGSRPPGSSAAEHQRRLMRGLARLLARSTLMLALLTVSYYLLPDQAPSGIDGGVRTGGTALGLLGVALVVRAQVRALRTGSRPILARIEALLTALYLIVLVFASVYYRLDATTPGQIEGIDNRTDALYFAMTIVSTVGFGDIHPVGTAARAIVTAHMLFNLLFVGTALRALGSSASVRSSVPGAVSGPPQSQ